MSKHNSIVYRGEPIDYREWTTWSGQQASGWSFRNYIKKVHPTRYSAPTLNECKQWLDDALDNAIHYDHLRDLHDAGCAEYYASKRPGDFTGD